VKISKWLIKYKNWPLAGFFGGVTFWFAAHEIGFYFSDYNCRHSWILPFVHLIALLGSVGSGLISYKCAKSETKFNYNSGIGIAAAALFSLVITWQGIATLIYSGCER
jgi:hypothetical protein